MPFVIAGVVLLTILAGMMTTAYLAAAAMAYMLRHRHRAVMRAWWWFGYHGLYQLDWKRRWLEYQRSPNPHPPLCGAGHWVHLGDGTMRGWCCDKVQNHWFGHRRTRDLRAIR